MVLKFLGIGKKKSEFVLEAPPVDSPTGSQPAAKAKPDPTPAKPAHVEAVAAPAVEKTIEKTVETNGKKPAKSGKTLKEANAEKRAKAEQKAQAGKKAQPEKKAAEVKAAPAAPPAPAPKAEPTITNFATTLQPNSTPRRRPGPSMNMFKDMAKQVNPKK
jgi:hypothetical protein